MPPSNTLKGCIEKNIFCWTPEVKVALHQIKKALYTLPTLANRIHGKMLQMHLSASNKAISSMLVVEWQGKKLPIYFVSRALQGLELNYPINEKLVLALVYTTWQLRRYFQAHQIEVLNSCPIKKVLLKLETSGRLAKWDIDLGEHDVSYHPQTSIKVKALANFLLKIPGKL